MTAQAKCVLVHQELGQAALPPPLVALIHSVPHPPQNLQPQGRQVAFQHAPQGGAAPRALSVPSSMFFPPRPAPARWDRELDAAERVGDRGLGLRRDHSRCCAAAAAEADRTRRAVCRLVRAGVVARERGKAGALRAWLGKRE
jgi:hypothetical protein